MWMDNIWRTLLFWWHETQSINPPVPLAEISFITDKFSVTEGNSAVVITLNRSVNYEEEVTVKVKVTPLPVDTATGTKNTT